MSEGFDAVALTIGLGNTSSLVHEDAKPEGVMDALYFLEHLQKMSDHHVPNKVAVIGGGNTAVDAAITAKKQGAKDVYLIYRRSFWEMPAWPAERDSLIKAGIHVLVLTQPVSYETKDGNQLSAVRVVHTELGPEDESGRRSPVAIPETEHALPVDIAIEAIGESVSPGVENVLESVEMTEKGLVKVAPDTLMTTRPGVFAAGDLVNGGTTVVQAVAEGRRMAEHIAQTL